MLKTSSRLSIKLMVLLICDLLYFFAEGQGSAGAALSVVSDVVQSSGTFLFK